MSTPEPSYADLAARVSQLEEQVKELLLRTTSHWEADRAHEIIQRPHVMEEELGKSIFPTFNVHVPLPADTAPVKEMTDEHS